MRFLVDLTVPDGVEPEAVADFMLDLLAGDPDAALAVMTDEGCPYESADFVDWQADR